jgi:hypothetical protein
MAQQCKTCKHPERAEIDSRLARGEGVEVVAADFELPFKSVQRHVVHVTARLAVTSGDGEALALEVAAMEAQLTQDLSAKIDFLQKEATRLKGVAVQLADMRSAMALLRELIRINEMKLKARQLDRARANDAGGGVSGGLSSSPVSPAVAKKMAETYLQRHHVGERLREIKEEENA